MSLTLIEGLILLSIAGVGGVVWWGVLRMVSTNDHTLIALETINVHLSLINGRLGKSETWMEMHQTQDSQQFEHIREQMRRMWEETGSATELTMWLLVILLLESVPGISPMTVLYAYATYEECRTERNRVGFDMAASYPYDRSFTVDCVKQGEKVNKGRT